MNPAAIAVPADAPIRQIVERLVEHRISAVPVVDADGAVTGIVSERDLIDEEKRRIRLPRTLLFGFFPLPEVAARGACDEGANLAARELATRDVLVVSEATGAYGCRRDGDATDQARARHA